MIGEQDNKFIKIYQDEFINDIRSVLNDFVGKKIISEDNTWLLEQYFTELWNNCIKIYHDFLGCIFETSKLEVEEYKNLHPFFKSLFFSMIITEKSLNFENFETILKNNFMESKDIPHNKVKDLEYEKIYKRIINQRKISLDRDFSYILNNFKEYEKLENISPNFLVNEIIQKLIYKKIDNEIKSLSNFDNNNSENIIFFINNINIINKKIVAKSDEDCKKNWKEVEDDCLEKIKKFISEAANFISADNIIKNDILFNKQLLVDAYIEACSQCFNDESSNFIKEIFKKIIEIYNDKLVSKNDLLSQKIIYDENSINLLHCTVNALVTSENFLNIVNEKKCKLNSDLEIEIENLKIKLSKEEESSEKTQLEVKKDIENKNQEVKNLCRNRHTVIMSFFKLYIDVYYKNHKNLKEDIILKLRISYWYLMIIKDKKIPENFYMPSIIEIINFYHEKKINLMAIKNFMFNNTFSMLKETLASELEIIVNDLKNSVISEQTAKKILNKKITEFETGISILEVTNDIAREEVKNHLKFKDEIEKIFEKKELFLLESIKSDHNIITPSRSDLCDVIGIENFNKLLSQHQKQNVLSNINENNFDKKFNNNYTTRVVLEEKVYWNYFNNLKSEIIKKLWKKNSEKTNEIIQSYLYTKQIKNPEIGFQSLFSNLKEYSKLVDQYVFENSQILFNSKYDINLIAAEKKIQDYQNLIEIIKDNGFVIKDAPKDELSILTFMAKVNPDVQPAIKKLAWSEAEKMVNANSSKEKNEHAVNRHFISKLIELNLRDTPLNPEWKRCLEEVREAYGKKWKNFFDNVEETIKNFILTNQFSLKPINLNGPPGIGKTTAAKDTLEYITNWKVVIINGETITKCDITGVPMSYRSPEYNVSTKGGIAAKSNICINLIDELDKMKPEDLVLLLTFLEAEAKKRLRDPILGEIDESKKMWVTTTNEFYKLPELIKDRLKNIDVLACDNEERFKMFCKTLYDCTNGYLNCTKPKEKKVLITFSQEVLKKLYEPASKIIKKNREKGLRTSSDHAKKIATEISWGAKDKESTEKEIEIGLHNIKNYYSKNLDNDLHDNSADLNGEKIKNDALKISIVNKNYDLLIDNSIYNRKLKHQKKAQFDSYNDFMSKGYKSEKQMFDQYNKIFLSIKNDDDIENNEKILNSPNSSIIIENPYGNTSIGLQFINESGQLSWLKPGDNAIPIDNFHINHPTIKNVINFFNSNDEQSNNNSEMYTSENLLILLIQECIIEQLKISNSSHNWVPKSEQNNSDVEDYVAINQLKKLILAQEEIRKIFTRTYNDNTSESTQSGKTINKTQGYKSTSSSSSFNPTAAGAFGMNFSQNSNYIPETTQVSTHHSKTQSTGNSVNSNHQISINVWLRNTESVLKSQLQNPLNQGIKSLLEKFNYTPSGYDNPKINITIIFPKEDYLNFIREHWNNIDSDLMEKYSFPWNLSLNKINDKILLPINSFFSKSTIINNIDIIRIQFLACNILTSMSKNIEAHHESYKKEFKSFNKNLDNKNHILSTEELEYAKRFEKLIVIKYVLQTVLKMSELVYKNANDNWKSNSKIQYNTHDVNEKKFYKERSIKTIDRKKNAIDKLLGLKKSELSFNEMTNKSNLTLKENMCEIDDCIQELIKKYTFEVVLPFYLQDENSTSIFFKSKVDDIKHKLIPSDAQTEAEILEKIVKNNLLKFFPEVEKTYENIFNFFYENKKTRILNFIDSKKVDDLDLLKILKEHNVDTIKTGEYKVCDVKILKDLNFDSNNVLVVTKNTNRENDCSSEFHYAVRTYDLKNLLNVQYESNSQENLDIDVNVNQSSDEQKISENLGHQSSLDSEPLDLSQFATQSYTSQETLTSDTVTSDSSNNLSLWNVSPIPIIQNNSKQNLSNDITHDGSLLVFPSQLTEDVLCTNYSESNFNKDEIKSEHDKGLKENYQNNLTDSKSVKNNSLKRACVNTLEFFMSL